MSSVRGTVWWDVYATNDGDYVVMLDENGTKTVYINKSEYNIAHTDFSSSIGTTGHVPRTLYDELYAYMVERFSPVLDPFEDFMEAF